MSLCHDTLGFIAAESAAVKNNFQDVKDCGDHVQMQSSQSLISSVSSWINPLEPENVSLFSFPCGLSSGVAQIMNLKTERFDMLPANI